MGGPEALRARLSAEALDLLKDAVLLVDGAGQVLAANCQARTALAQGDGIRLGEEGLEVWDRAAELRLKRALSRAVGTPRQSSSLRVARPSGAPDLRVAVRPLADRGGAAVFIRDPAGLEHPDPQCLAEFYGLTRMEAQVAARMVCGPRLHDIAQDLGVATETVRGHLKRIYAKTGTHRQAELVSLLLLGIASLVY